MHSFVLERGPCAQTPALPAEYMKVISASLGKRSRAETICMSRGGRDNRSNQLNPNNYAYWQSQGWTSRPDDWHDILRSNQLNPHNDAYWQSRGWNKRPADWRKRVAR